MKMIKLLNFIKIVRLAKVIEETKKIKNIRKNYIKKSNLEKDKVIIINKTNNNDINLYTRSSVLNKIKKRSKQLNRLTLKENRFISNNKKLSNENKLYNIIQQVHTVDYSDNDFLLYSFFEEYNNPIEIESDKQFSLSCDKIYVQTPNESIAQEKYNDNFNLDKIIKDKRISSAKKLKRTNSDTLSSIRLNSAKLSSNSKNLNSDKNDIEDIQIVKKQNFLPLSNYEPKKLIDKKQRLSIKPIPRDKRMSILFNVNSNQINNFRKNIFSFDITNNINDRNTDRIITTSNYSDNEYLLKSDRSSEKDSNKNSLEILKNKNNKINSIKEVDENQSSYQNINSSQESDIKRKKLNTKKKKVDIRQIKIIGGGNKKIDKDSIENIIIHNNLSKIGKEIISRNISKPSEAIVTAYSTDIVKIEEEWSIKISQALISFIYGKKIIEENGKGLGDKLTESINRKVVIMIMLLLIFFPIIDSDYLNTLIYTNDQNPLFTDFCLNSINVFFNASIEDPNKLLFLNKIINKCVNITYENERYPLFLKINFSEYKLLNNLTEKYTETNYSSYLPNTTYVNPNLDFIIKTMHKGGDYSINSYFFNNSKIDYISNEIIDNKLNSLLNIVRTLFVSILLLISTSIFTNDITVYVIKPIDLIIAKLQIYMKNTDLVFKIDPLNMQITTKSIILLQNKDKKKVKDLNLKKLETYVIDKLIKKLISLISISLGKQGIII